MSTSYASPKTTTSSTQTKTLQIPIRREFTTPQITSFSPSSYNLEQVKSKPTRLSNIKIPIQAKFSSLSTTPRLPSIRKDTIGKTEAVVKRRVIPSITIFNPKVASKGPMRVVRKAPETGRSGIRTTPIEALISNANKQIRELETNLRTATGDQELIYEWKIREISRARDAAMRVQKEGEAEIEEFTVQVEEAQKEFDRRNDEWELSKLKLDDVISDLNTEGQRPDLITRLKDIRQMIHENDIARSSSQDTLFRKKIQQIDSINRLSERVSDEYVRESARQYEDTKREIDVIVDKLDTLMEKKPDVGTELALKRWKSFRDYVRDTRTTVSVAEMERTMVMISKSLADIEIMKTERSNLQSKLTTMESQYNKQIELMRNDNARLKSHISELENKLNDATINRNAELKQHQTTINNLQSQIKQLQEKMVQSNKKVESLTSDLRFEREKNQTRLLHIEQLTNTLKSSIAKNEQLQKDNLAQVQSLEKELSNEKNINKSHTNQIDKLSKQLESLKNQSQRALEEKVNEISSLKKKLSTEQSQNDLSKIQISQLTDDLRKSKEERQKMQTEMVEKIGILTKELSKEKTKTQQIQGQIGELTKSLTESEREKLKIQEELSRKIRDFETRLANEQSKVQGYKERIDELNMTMESSEKSSQRIREDANKKIESLQTELNNERNKSRETQENVDSLTRKLNEMIEENKRMKDDMNSRISSIQSELDDEKSKTRSSQDKIDELTQNLTKLTEENQEMKRNMLDIRKFKTLSEKKRNEILKELGYDPLEVQNLQTELQTANDRLEQRNILIAEQENNLRKLSNERKWLDAQIEEKEKSLRTARERVNGLESKVLTLEIENIKRQRKLEEKEQTVKYLTQNLNNQNNENEKLKQEIATLNDQNAKNNALIEKLQEELSSSDTRYRESQKLVQDRQAEIDELNKIIEQLREQLEAQRKDLVIYQNDLFRTTALQKDAEDKLKWSTDRIKSLEFQRELYHTRYDDALKILNSDTVLSVEFAQRRNELQSIIDKLIIENKAIRSELDIKNRALVTKGTSLDIEKSLQELHQTKEEIKNSIDQIAKAYKEASQAELDVARVEIERMKLQNKRNGDLEAENKFLSSRLDSILDGIKNIGDALKDAELVKAESLTNDLLKAFSKSID